MIPFSTVTEKLLNGGGLFEMLLKHLFPPLRVKGKRRKEEPDYAAPTIDMVFPVAKPMGKSVLD